MIKRKLNQVQAAIFRTLGARDARANELKFRLKRLLAADRGLGGRSNSQDEKNRRYAFYSREPRGTGVDNMYSDYEAFALLAAIMLLEHGLPQASAVRVMREVRRELEAAHAQCLKKDPKALFDQRAIAARALPGVIATDNTAPIFLAFVRLTDSSVDHENAGKAVAVCHGDEELFAFIRQHCIPGTGTGATFFEFVRLMHRLAAELSQTRAVKRGRAAIR
jgi:hypothetical protein